MNYSKQNLHGGMMSRVQRQNDRMFEKQNSAYSNQIERLPVLNLDKKQINGEMCLNEFKEVQFIKNPPVRVLTRSERLPRLNKGRF